MHPNLAEAALPPATRFTPAGARRVSPDHFTAPHMRPYTALALLVCLGSPLAAQRASGEIEGDVIDSVHVSPLIGATRLGGAHETTFVATTDKRGRFRFESLDAGRYAVRFSSAMLDSLQYGGRTPVVDVAPNRATRVELAVPSAATLRALACPGVTFADGTGALLGLVTDAESGKPLVGAQVAVAWSDLAIDSANAVVADDR